ncbi:MAG: EamA family transporter [Bacteroidetes bacterium]|nr:EamA family transporter [Bacteroidota bacterium]
MEQEKVLKVTLLGFILTFAGSILFSTKAIAVKLAFRHTEMNGLTLLALRMFFSLPFYIVAAYIASNKKDAAPITSKQWTSIIILGLFGYYLSSLFDFLGLQYISAGLERLILFLYPSFAVLINALIFKQHITQIQKIALLLTYAGIAWAFWGELRVDVNNPNFLWGSILIFLCSVTFAVYLVGSGKLIPQVGASRFTAYAMLAATVGIFLHFLLSEKISAIDISGSHIWYGIYLALVATVLPTFMIAAGMKQIGSNNVAIISSIGPVSTILQAHFILDEPLFWAQWGGTALVVAGVLLTAGKSGKNLHQK